MQEALPAASGGSTDGLNKHSSSPSSRSVTQQTPGSRPLPKLEDLLQAKLLSTTTRGLSGVAVKENNKSLDAIRAFLGPSAQISQPVNATTANDRLLARLQEGLKQIGCNTDDSINEDVSDAISSGEEHSKQYSKSQESREGDEQRRKRSKSAHADGKSRKRHYSRSADHHSKAHKKKRRHKGDKKEKVDNGTANHKSDDEKSETSQASSERAPTRLSSPTQVSTREKAGSLLDQEMNSDRSASIDPERKHIGKKRSKQSNRTKKKHKSHGRSESDSDEDIEDYGTSKKSSRRSSKSRSHSREPSLEKHAKSRSKSKHKASKHKKRHKSSKLPQSHSISPPDDSEPEEDMKKEELLAKVRSMLQK